VTPNNLTRAKMLSMLNLSLETANVIYTLSNLILVLGALFVLLGTVGAVFSGGIRERFADERISKNEAETATANARAAEADQRAAEANLELIRIKAPRRLTPAQQETIIAKLKQFAGTPFDIGLVQGDAEAAELMIQIEAVLTATGWTQTDWVGGDILMTRAGKPKEGLVTATSVVIVLHPQNASTLGNAAATLIDALSLEGIPIRTDTTEAGFQNNNAGAVHVLVGRKDLNFP
jgi:hypothetical protein